MARDRRKDAVRVNEVDAFHSIIPYMMPKRTEAEVSMTEIFDVTELRAYIRRRNADENLNLKLFHAVCTAIARTIYHRPKLNRFIAGRRYWERNKITLSFVAKQTFNDESEERLMFMTVKPDMNLDSISKLILGDVKKARADGSNDLDKLMSAVGKIPRFILEIFFGILRILEYHGIMPDALTAGDPNYSTVLLANLGSIGCGAPYHHLSNYGTCSMMITIGAMRTVDTKDGQRDELPMTLTLDERIADGFYFAKSLKLTKYMLEHPEILTEKVECPIPMEV